MGPSVVIPLRDDGTLALGIWQGIFFCEFDGPRERSVYVTVLRNAAHRPRRRYAPPLRSARHGRPCPQR